MEIKDINHANLNDYEPLVNSDESENIGRTCCHGMMAYDLFEPRGAMVWTQMNIDSDDPSEEIGFFDVLDEEAAADLMEEHDSAIESDGIRRSFMEAADMPDSIRHAMEEAGFKVSSAESRDIIIDVGWLDNIKVPKSRVPDYITGIDCLSEMELWNGLTLCLYNGRKGLVEDLDLMTEEWFEADISSCVRADGNVEGLLLIHRTLSGVLMPVLFYCDGRNQNKNLMYMLRFSINAIKKKYSRDTRILLRRHNEATIRLISYLFPDARGETVYRCERRTED